jgi:antitoxin HigA-1
MGRLKLAKNFRYPVHPGEFLKEMLDDMGMSQAKFAHAIGLSAMKISRLIQGRQPVNAEMALILGKAFGQSPQYWINLQTVYDLKTEEKGLRRRLSSIHKIYRDKN